MIIVGALFFLCFCGQQMIAIIPFNPTFNRFDLLKPLQYDLNKPTDATINANPSTDTLRGSITMLNNNLSYEKDAKNASRAAEGSVWVLDNNWVNPTKRPEPWVTWDSEDKNKSRLFRPFMFYDVMGMMEEAFEKNVDLREYKGVSEIRDYVLSVARKPQAVDPNKSPFAKALVSDLRNWHSKGFVQKSIPGKIVILDGYVIWNEGKQSKQTISQQKQEHLDYWSGDIARTGIMGALECCDIRYLQQKYPNAIFQIASNFNCLEGGIEKHALENMQYQPVQGELAVSCTMGGGFIRKYRIPFDDRNLLSGIGATIDFDKNKHDMLVASFKKPLSDADIPNIAVGVHKHVMVTSGYYPPFIQTDLSKIPDTNDKNAINKNNLAFEKQRLDFLFANNLVQKGRDLIFVYNGEVSNNIFVNQIFVSAISLQRGSADKTEIQNAQIILKAMYEGTILAAAKLFIENKVPVKDRFLFLTLVGAGAFWNEIEWIMDALNQKIIIDTIRATGMTAVIVIYPDIRVGRGLDARKYNERNNSVTMAIPGIYDIVDQMNKKIKIVNSDAAAAVENLAQACKDLI